ncbi:YdbL family protein [Marinicella rhabdoformis]|uniref:YdbL family protein n=1 Tax=Marinicella rhabdoformis TaxID=2580566 RepID=UPI0012AECD2B|nr:YdbL family protein [Marinicella rhabdoformis]
MKKWYRSLFIFSFVFVAACVTINVYFPAAEVESAAEKVVKDILGDENEAPASDEQGSLMPDMLMIVTAVNPINWFIGTAHAQAEADIDVSSPAINALTARIKGRYESSLKSFLDNQTIGFTNQGFVEVVDDASLGLKDRQVAKKLVADENRDRQALYREVAVANDHPEWEDKIQKAFVKQWTAQAKKGWKYQNQDGQWVVK